MERFYVMNKTGAQVRDFPTEVAAHRFCIHYFTKVARKLETSTQGGRTPAWMLSHVAGTYKLKILDSKTGEASGEDSLEVASSLFMKQAS